MLEQRLQPEKEAQGVNFIVLTFWNKVKIMFFHEDICIFLSISFKCAEE